jgi:hypothetical protein
MIEAHVFNRGESIREFQLFRQELVVVFPRCHEGLKIASVCDLNLGAFRERRFVWHWIVHSWSGGVFGVGLNEAGLTGGGFFNWNCAAPPVVGPLLAVVKFGVGVSKVIEFAPFPGEISSKDSTCPAAAPPGISLAEAMNVPAMSAPDSVIACILASLVKWMTVANSSAS